jgi:hypothetical protein
MMKRFLPWLGFPVAALFAVAPSLAADQPTAAPVTVEYYYKLAPGAAQEWLNLYKKNHNPILQQLRKEGMIVSERLFERRFHAASPAWDYKVVMVWRDWSALEQARQREPEIIRALYPNKEDHDRQERRRWEITEQHWDDVLSEVPLD